MGPERPQYADRRPRLLIHGADASPHPGGVVDDDIRGLTPDGQAQARELVARLGCFPIRRVLSSPALRCRQTVTPLARTALLEVEPSPLLAAGADPGQLVRFLRSRESAGLVLCTHRGLLLGVFCQLIRYGSRVVEGILPIVPAAAWAVWCDPDRPGRLVHLEPLWAPDAASLPASPPAVAATTGTGTTPHAVAGGARPAGSAP